MTKRRSVSTQTTLLSLGTAISQAITAILFIVTARTSHVEVFGLVATSIAGGIVAAGLLDFGFNSLLTRELASGRVSMTSFNSRAKSKLLIGLFVSVLWFASTIQFGIYQAASSLVFLSVLTFQTVLVPLRADSRSFPITMLFILERTSAMTLFFALTSLGIVHVQSLIIALLTGTCIASSSALMILAKAEKNEDKRKGLAWPWHGTKGYGLSSFANSMQQLDLPLLAAFAGPTMAGIYASVSKWTQPLGIVANAFATAATPFIAKSSSTRAAIQDVKKSFWLILLACCGSAFMIPLAPFIVDLLLGKAYAGSVEVLQLLAFGTIPAILNQVLATGMQARSYDRQVAIISISGVALQLLLIIFTSSYGGAMAAAFAYCTLQLGILITLAITLVRKLRLELNN